MIIFCTDLSSNLFGNRNGNVKVLKVLHFYKQLISFFPTKLSSKLLTVFWKDVFSPYINFVLPFYLSNNLILKLYSNQFKTLILININVWKYFSLKSQYQDLKDLSFVFFSRIIQKYLFFRCFQKTAASKIRLNYCYQWFHFHKCSLYFLTGNNKSNVKQKFCKLKI